MKNLFIIILSTLFLTTMSYADSIKYIRNISNPSEVITIGYLSDDVEIPLGYELIEGHPPKGSVVTDTKLDPVQSVRKEFMTLPVKKQVELAPTLQLGLFFIEQGNKEAMEELAKSFNPKDQDEMDLLLLIKKEFDIKDE